MSWSRSRSRVLGAILVSTLVLPAVALLAVSAIDRGPSGEPRASLFPAALALLDPFLWECLRNSTIVAGIVAFGSLWVGVALARIISGWRFRGRPLLATLATGPAVVPPLYLAVGLLYALPTGSLQGWFSGASGLGGAWLALAWVNAVPGCSLVALEVGRALSRVDPIGADAGRAAGARPRHIWRSLIWPQVRRDALRATATVFGLTLFEPGVPLLFNLRRTLGFQLIDEIYDAGTAARPAMLVLLGLIVVMLVQGAASIGRSPGLRTGSQDPARSASWLREIISAIVLSGWCLAAWWPVVGLVRGAAATGGGDSSGWSTAVAALRGLSSDPIVGPALGASVLLGGTAATLALLIALAITGRGPTDGPAGRRALAVLAQIPPAALGLGVLFLPILLDAAAVGVGSGLNTAGRTFAGWLDPYRTPGVSLVLALATFRLPVMAGHVIVACQRYRPVYLDAAITLGASKRRAGMALTARLAWPGLARAWLLAAILSASDVPLALLLTPSSVLRPVAPALLARLDLPGNPFGVDRVPAALTLAVMIGNLAAFTLVSGANRSSVDGLTSRS
jgi:ABC-type Fe3+ transport system permease subunit